VKLCLHIRMRREDSDKLRKLAKPWFATSDCLQILTCDSKAAPRPSAHRDREFWCNKGAFVGLNCDPMPPYSTGSTAPSSRAAEASVPTREELFLPGTPSETRPSTVAAEAP
jgi:hypothetical protein